MDHPFRAGLRVPPTAAAPVELRAAGARRVPRWIRALFRRRAPRARVVAPPEVRLGERLEVEWSVGCPAGNLVSVSVALVGSEIVRAAPEPGLRVVCGRASVVVPPTAVPSVAGRRNEIAWTIVVEAELAPAGGAPGLQQAGLGLLVVEGDAVAQVMPPVERTRSQDRLAELAATEGPKKTVRW